MLKKYLTQEHGIWQPFCPSAFPGNCKVLLGVFYNEHLFDFVCNSKVYQGGTFEVVISGCSHRSVLSGCPVIED